MVALRSAVQTDSQRLFELDQVCFPAGIAYGLAEFVQLLASKRTIAVVAEDGAELVGFVLAKLVSFRGRPAAHVVTIDVAPSRRRLGVGKMLMGEVERRSREGGAAAAT